MTGIEQQAGLFPMPRLIPFHAATFKHMEPAAPSVSERRTSKTGRLQRDTQILYIYLVSLKEAEKPYLRPPSHSQSQRLRRAKPEGVRYAIYVAAAAYKEQGNGMEKRTAWSVRV